MLGYCIVGYIGWVLITMRRNFNQNAFNEFISTDEVCFETMLTIIVINMVSLYSFFIWMVNFNWIVSLLLGYMITSRTLDHIVVVQPLSKVYLMLDYMIRYSALSLTVYPVGLIMVMPILLIRCF
jgi:hypothetical protein